MALRSLRVRLAHAQPSAQADHGRACPEELRQHDFDQQGDTVE